MRIAACLRLCQSGSLSCQDWSFLPQPWQLCPTVFTGGENIKSIFWSSSTVCPIQVSSGHRLASCMCSLKHAERQFSDTSRGHLPKLHPLILNILSGAIKFTSGSHASGSQGLINLTARSLESIVNICLVALPSPWLFFLRNCSWMGAQRESCHTTCF